MAKAKSRIVRRSIALPNDLFEEVVSTAPVELQGNWNRLVVTLLRDFVSRRKIRMFEEAMAAMANDPAIRTQCAAIAEEFAAAESDGIGDG